MKKKVRMGERIDLRGRGRRRLKLKVTQYIANLEARPRSAQRPLRGRDPREKLSFLQIGTRGGTGAGEAGKTARCRRLGAFPRGKGSLLAPRAENIEKNS